MTDYAVRIRQPDKNRSSFLDTWSTEELAKKRLRAYIEERNGIIQTSNRSGSFFDKETGRVVEVYIEAVYW